MSGQNGAHDAAQDEAARLEAALDRIARAAAQAQQQAVMAPQEIGLRQDAPHATTQADAAPETAEVAARLDSLIADIRGVLGTQGM